MKIKWQLSIGYALGNREDEFEIDDSEVEGMSEDEKYEYIDQIVRDETDSYIDRSWEIAGEDE